VGWGGGVDRGGFVLGFGDLIFCLEGYTNV